MTPSKAGLATPLGTVIDLRSDDDSRAGDLSWVARGPDKRPGTGQGHPQPDLALPSMSRELADADTPSLTEYRLFNR